MKSIRYCKPGLKIVHVPDENIKGGRDVKIKVAYCGICGSDAHYYAGHFDKMLEENGAEFPFPLGHEASGTVVEVGPDVRDIKVGDKVCYYYDCQCGSCYHCRNKQDNHCDCLITHRSAMSEYLVVDEKEVFVLPDNMDLVYGALVEPLSVCMYAADKARISTGSRVAISGCGALGLMLLQIVKHAGAGKIAVIEPVAEKRELALKMGADYVIDPVNQDIVSESAKITNNLFFDSVIEVSGAKSACTPAFTVLAKCGTLVFLALYGYGYKHPINMWDAFMKEARIQFVYRTPYIFPRTVEMMKRFDLEPFTWNIHPMKEFRTAFEEQASGKYPKVLLTISG